MKSHKVIGLMSGSSLDGLDIAVCEFQMENHQLKAWQLLYSETIELPFFLREQLYEPLKLSEASIQSLESELTDFFIDSIKRIRTNHPDIDLIGSHGHTIQHLPKQKITRQLGDIGKMADALQLPVVGDFRQQDLLAGGVGTPMAPLADKDLFSGYQFYLNLGGIANVSYQQDGDWSAYDIAAANQVLNFFAQKEGLEFDKDGDMAEEGNLSRDLLDFLLTHPFVNRAHPKSLDNSEVMKEWIIPIENFNLSVRDTLYTYTEFLALLLQKTFAEAGIQEGKILITGGGAHNKYLIEKFYHHNPAIDFSPASNDTINFKEAILIAYAALLKKCEIPNFIGSVTGASEDVVGGTIVG